MAEMERLCNLPEEIIKNIMLWVPADSLVQIKSVNKFWYSLISGFINDPYFVAKHLFITKHHPSTTLLFTGPYLHVDHTRHLITHTLLTISYGNDDGENEHYRTVKEALSLPLIYSESSFDTDYIYRSIYSDGTRHCDGLILLVNHELGTMLLCNPTLKESMILPEPNYLKTCFNKDKNEIRQKSPYVEFGHDSKSNDYKCVAIWCGEHMCKAEVYTMGSDSWRKIKMCQDITDGELSSGFCWKGVCYWMVDRTGNGFTSILSFNMSNEEFHFIHLPDFEYWTINKYDVKFSVWYDSIVLFVKSAKERILRIFKMDVSEAGSCSWTEYVHANPVKCFYNEAPFWKNDEILMQLWNEVNKLESFNIHTLNTRDIVCDRDGDEIELFYWKSFYVKSLVHVRRR